MFLEVSVLLAEGHSAVRSLHVYEQYAFITCVCPLFLLFVCVCALTQMEQSEGQPQQRGFSFKAVFRRGPEVPIADRIAAAEKEMHALDQVCKEKRRQLRSGEGSGVYS